MSDLAKDLAKIINKSFILSGAGSLTEDHVRLITEKIPDLSELVPSNSPLKEYEDKIFMMVTMLKKWAAGREVKKEWELIASCAFVIGYMIHDVDLVPDFLEDIGDWDDVAVVRAMLVLFQDEFKL